MPPGRTDRRAAGSVAAVVLAGGRGERLGGVNKAFLEIGGVRFVDRLREALAGCAPVLLAVGRRSFAVEGLRSVPDLDGDYAGPLAGVTAAAYALEGLGAEWLLSVAVDTPFFPPDFHSRATALGADVDVVLGCYAGQAYPTNALWRLAALHDLPGNVRNGTAPHSLKRLAAGLRSRRLDYADVVAEDPFVNANTPEDLENLRFRESRLARG